MFIRQYRAALASGEGFPGSDGLPEAWLAAIGFRLAAAACANGLVDERYTLLRLARPSLKFKAPFDPAFLTSDDPFPIGASKIFGIPDLPAGANWPTQRDCNVLFGEDSETDSDLPCSFVAQINCEELAGSLLADYFPSKGLISIFSCTVDGCGWVDTFVTFSPDTSNLVRMIPPRT